MTPEADDVEKLQRAKQALLKKYGQRGWFRGVGIVPGTGGMRLRLNVSPEKDLGDDELPARFQGFDVEIVKIAAYSPRPRSRRDPN